MTSYGLYADARDLVQGLAMQEQVIVFDVQMIERFQQQSAEMVLDNQRQIQQERARLNLKFSKEKKRLKEVHQPTFVPQPEYPFNRL